MDSIAFAGTADLDKNELADLLEDVLPDPVSVFISTDWEESKGLSKLVSWMEDVNQPYTIVNDTLSSAPEVLALFWDDTDETYLLLERATEAGVHVVDMTAAFDDLILDEGATVDTEAEVQEPEIEDVPLPEPEKLVEEPAKPRRTRKQEEKFQAEKERVSVSEPKFVAAPEEVEAADELSRLGQVIENWVEDAEEKAAFNLLNALAEFVDARIEKAFNRELAALNAKNHIDIDVPNVTINDVVTGNDIATSFEVQPGHNIQAVPETKSYVKDADGTLRKRGRGKLRKGSIVVELTDAEALAAGIEL